MSKEQAAEEVAEDHALGDRFLFNNADDRVLVTPSLLDKDFLADGCELMDFKNLLNLAPKNCTNSLCESILADNELAGKLEKIIQENPGIKVHAYTGKAPFLKLVDTWKAKGLVFGNAGNSRRKKSVDPKFFWKQSRFPASGGRFGGRFSQDAGRGDLFFSTRTTGVGKVFSKQGFGLRF